MDENQNPKDYQQENYEELEIDLREYIMLLWRKKWFIGALIVIAAVGAYIFTITTTEVKHRAISDVLIMPPRYTELEVSRMGKSTYANLAKSDDILGRIIEKLELQKDGEELLHPSDIDDRMELQIMEDDDVAEEEESFIMRMEVTGTDPEETSDIANAWAELFKQDTLDVRRGEIEEIFDVTKRRFEETETNLEEAQEKLQDLKIEARLERLSDQKEVFRENLRDIESKLLFLQEELGVKEARKQNKMAQVDEREIDGVWQGEIYSYLFSEEMTENNYWVVEDLLDSHQKLASARQEKLNLELQEIESVMAEEPEKYSLKRSFSEDVLWDKFFSPEELNLLSDVVLEEEIMNSVYRSLRQDRADTEIELRSTFAGEISENDLNLREAIADYGEEVVPLLEEDVEHYQKIYDYEQENYIDLKNELAKLEIEIADLKSEIDYYNSREQEVEQKIENMEEQIWQFERKKETVEREVDRYEQSYERLSSQMEDARLAMAEQTSDVRFVSAAVPPGRTIGRGTSLNVAIAMVLAGMAGVFIVFFQEFMKVEDEE